METTLIDKNDDIFSIRCFPFFSLTIIEISFSDNHIKHSIWCHQLNKTFANVCAKSAWANIIYDKTKRTDPREIVVFVTYLCVTRIHSNKMRLHLISTEF